MGQAMHAERVCCLTVNRFAFAAPIACRTLGLWSVGKPTQLGTPDLHYEGGWDETAISAKTAFGTDQPGVPELMER